MSINANEARLISITPTKVGQKSPEKYGKILLVKPPYFTPWTPPLGIAIMKSYLQQQGYTVRCFDFNTDPELWGMHHQYFGRLQQLEDVSTNDGYSKLWWILNAHMLAYANDSDAATCARVLESVIPLYGMKTNSQLIDALIPLVDRFFKRLGEVTDSLDLSDYTVTGTSTYTTSLGSSLFFLKRLKEKHPSLTTVMGGGVFADDLALGSDNLSTLIENYPYVDHIILGEGELLFLKLLQGELAHKRVISIADLKGTTLEMKDVPAPDFSDLNLENYFHLTIEGARSCPFQCSFCSETIQWGDYRKKPIDLFVRQVIDLAHTHQNNSFFMGDSLMNPYLEPFSRGLLSRNADILYDGYLRADKPVTHRDKARNWSRSGFYRARLGIESASARILEAMDKCTTPQVISDALRTLANAGIRTTTYWIVGFPGETESDFEETLEFVRANYRYIYELEAHPYYYYPYGQIGSRLYQSKSLYPDAVTEIIRFQVWDIIDGQPTREQRYERLSRMSSLASELGLPNIYTMADRYQAENRWLQLYPLARKVYAGTQLHRDELQLPNHPVEIFTNWRSAEEAAPAVEVLSYRADVQKKLDESVLLTSVRKLIQSSELAQFDVQDGKYVPAPPDEQAISKVLRIFSEDKEPVEQDRIIDSLAAEMRSAAGDSIRVAVINHQEDCCSLILLAHRALFDSRSVVLLLEDLFRIYERLSNGQEVSLAAVQKTYADFVIELTGAEKHSASFRPATSKKRAAGDHANDVSFVGRRFALDQSLRMRMFSETLTRAGFTSGAMMLSALISSLAGAAIEIDIPVDARSSEPGIEKTVGALTRSYQLPARLLREGINVREAQPMLTAMSNPVSAETSHERMFFNLEYFTRDPWLGGDEWSPQGFIVNESSLREDYLLEIAPVPLADGVQVLMRYRDTSDSKELVEHCISVMPKKLAAIISSCESYVTDKKFWLDEFGKDMPPVEEGESAAYLANDVWLSVACRFETDLLRRLVSAFPEDLSAILLAAYGVLLSRLNGQEDLAVLFCRGTSKGIQIAPVRLAPTWTQSFAEFAGEAKEKSLQALAHGAHVFEILNHDLPLTRSEGHSPVFSACYTFNAGPDGIAAVENALEVYSAANRRLALALEVTAGNEVSARLVYRSGRFDNESMVKLSSYLGAILEEVSKNPNLALGDIALTHESRQPAAAYVLAEDTFNFG